MVTDTVSDILIRLKNGYMARRSSIVVPKSKIALALFSLLVKNGYLEKLEIDGQNLNLMLKYHHKSPVLTDLKRVSKPGRRIYGSKNHLPRVLGGHGIAVISTPLGLLTDKEAREKNVGGEILCKIW